MKTFFQWLVAGILIAALSGCGGTSGTTSNDTNNNDGNKQNALLEGGTINNPTPLQFEKVYNIPEAYKTYVKVTVEQFQRITFDIAVDTTNDYKYDPVVVYDASGKSVDEVIAYGDTNTKNSGSYYHYSKKLTQDFIFLKAGTYMLQFTFEATHWRRTYTTPSKCELIAHDLGTIIPKKIQKNGNYISGLYLIKLEKNMKLSFENFDGKIFNANMKLLSLSGYPKKCFDINLIKGEYLFINKSSCKIYFFEPDEVGYCQTITGGTMDHPTPIQYNKPYEITSQKAYIYLNAEQFQRVTFSSNTYNSTPFTKIYDKDMNVIDIYAHGSAWENKTNNDYIFLKKDKYIIELLTRETITVRDLGITQLPKVQNRGSYQGKEDEYKYFSLEMKEDGDVNFKAHNYTYCKAMLYDTELNIIENLNDVEDINITLSQGNYLFHPTHEYYDCTITFQNP